MNNYLDSFSLKLSIIALRAALLSMAVVSVAYAGEAADEASAAELVKPISQIEIGGIYINNKNWKYGEYNGLDDSGGYGIANIDLRGGGAYDSDSTARWSIKGRDLGLDTRKISAEYGQQGKFRINLGFDQFMKNGNGDYQTPFVTNGTNNFVLPSGWVKPVQGNVNPNAAGNNYPAFAGSTGYNTRALSTDFVNNDYVMRFNSNAALCISTPSAANCAGGLFGQYLPSSVTNNTAGWPGTGSTSYLQTMLNTAATDTALFRNVKIDTERRKWDVGGSYTIDPRLEFTTSITHEDKVGTRLQTFVPNGETVMVLPDEMDQTHDQYSAALNYTGDNAFFKTAYYGSVFKQKNPVVSFVNPSGSGINGQDNNPPSNQLHEIRMTGGYNYNPTTKLVGEVSYGRNTQNETFLASSLTGPLALPSATANAEVINTSAFLKLTAKPVKDLNLAVAYKYDNRDNQTPVRTFYVMDLDNTKAAGTDANNIFNYALGLANGTMTTGSTGVNMLNNRAFSKRSQRVNLDADYLIAQGNAVKLGYDYENIYRHCTDSWTACVDVANTYENTGRVEYRNTMKEDLTGKISYAYSRRTGSDYNSEAFLALTPAARLVPDQTMVNTGGYSMFSFLQSVKQFGITAYGPNKGLPAAIAALASAPTAATVKGDTRASSGFVGNIAGSAAGAQNAAVVAAWKAAYPGMTDAQANALITFMGYNGGIASATYYANGETLQQDPNQQRAYVGDRDRNKVRASTNWQVNDKLSLTTAVDYNQDKYTNSTIGLQKASSFALNLDSTFAFNDKVSAGAYYTYGTQNQDMSFNNFGTNAWVAASSVVTTGGSLATGAAGSVTGGCYDNVIAKSNNAKIDACNSWSTKIKDRNDTIGINLSTKGLFSSKLDLGGDVVYTWANTSQKFSGVQAVNTLLTNVNVGGSATTWTTAFVPMQDLPDVKAEVLTLKLSGKYTVDKHSAFRGGYMYQRMTSSNWFYEALQAGSTPTGVMPTNEKAPVYKVQSIGAAYIYSF